MTTCLIYAAIYCAFLVITGAVFDAVTPLGLRLLVPVVPSLVVTVAWLLRSQPFVAVTLSLVFVVTVLQQARTVSLYGIDYSGRVWSAARISRASLPPGDLYSTWPAAVAYFTDRSPRHTPAPWDQDNNAPNLDYQSKTAQLARDVRNGKASVIVLNEAFLEISGTTPITNLPAFKNECRAVTKVVFVCTHRRASRRDAGDRRRAASAA